MLNLFKVIKKKTQWYMSIDNVDVKSQFVKSKNTEQS